VSLSQSANCLVLDFSLFSSTCPGKLQDNYLDIGHDMMGTLNFEGN
jgi:hypothetical protein